MPIGSNVETHPRPMTPESGVEFLRRGDEIRRDIVRAVKERRIDKEDTTTLLRALAEHDFDAGLKLAEDLRMSPFDVKANLFHDMRMFMKHSLVLKALQADLKSVKSELEAVGIEEWTRAENILNTLTDVERYERYAGGRMASRQSVVHPRAQELLRDLDAHYAEILRARAKDLPPIKELPGLYQETAAEDKAMRTLEVFKAALEHKEPSQEMITRYAVRQLRHDDPEGIENAFDGLWKEEQKRDQKAGTRLYPTVRAVKRDYQRGLISDTDVMSVYARQKGRRPSDIEAEITARMGRATWGELQEASRPKQLDSIYRATKSMLRDELKKLAERQGEKVAFDSKEGTWKLEPAPEPEKSKAEFSEILSERAKKILGDWLGKMEIALDKKATSHYASGEMQRIEFHDAAVAVYAEIRARMGVENHEDRSYLLSCIDDNLTKIDPTYRERVLRTVTRTRAGWRENEIPTVIRGIENLKSAEAQLASYLVLLEDRINQIGMERALSGRDQVIETLVAKWHWFKENQVVSAALALGPRDDDAAVAIQQMARLALFLQRGDKYLVDLELIALDINNPSRTNEEFAFFKEALFNSCVQIGEYGRAEMALDSLGEPRKKSHETRRALSRAVGVLATVYVQEDYMADAERIMKENEHEGFHPNPRALWVQIQKLQNDIRLRRVKADYVDQVEAQIKQFEQIAGPQQAMWARFYIACDFPHRLKQKLENEGNSIDQYQGPYEALNRLKGFMESILKGNVKEYGLRSAEAAALPGKRAARLLNLLNLLEKPDLQEINEMLATMNQEALERQAAGWRPREPTPDKSIPKKFREPKKEKPGLPPWLVASIEEHPEDFLNTLPAVSETREQARMLAERLFAQIFPEVIVERERKARRARLGAIVQKVFRFEFGREPGRAIEARDVLRPRATHDIKEPDPHWHKDAKEVMRFREPFHGFASTELYGKHEADGVWRKTYFGVPEYASPPAKEVTWTIDVPDHNLFRLPRPPYSRFLPERTRGRRKDGSEVALEEHVSSLGEIDFKDIPKEVVSISVSFEMSLAPPQMSACTSADLARAYRDLGEAASALTEKIGPLPAELKPIIEGIKREPDMRKRLEQIESLVRMIGHYDFEEVKNPTRGTLPFDKRIAAMATRMDALRKKGKLTSASEKKLAGICNDFAEITTALLREAGFASGIATGFKGSGKNVTVADYHAVSFVLMPSEGGGLQRIYIDGTPNGTTGDEKVLIEAVRLPTVAEQQKQAAAALEEVKQQAAADIDEILRRSPEEIRGMDNGVLENALNLTLLHTVKKENLAAVQRVLEAFWYTPLAREDLARPENRPALRSFVGDEFRLERVGQGRGGEDEMQAGTRMFEMVEEYLQRFKKRDGLPTAQALDRAEAVFGAVGEALSETERRATAAIITYLRAKNVVR